MSVSGSVIPLPLKPVPEVVIDEIVRLALPVLLTTTACVPLLPTVTLPKPTLVGLGVSWITCATPVPLSDTNVGLLEALLTKEICPEALPADAGANCVVYVELCPGVRVSGRVMPLPLKPVPEVVIDEIVRFAFPVFVTTTDCVPLVPTVMFPKLTLVGLGVSWTIGAATPVPLSGTEVGLLEALLTKDICPEAALADVGAN